MCVHFIKVILCQNNHLQCGITCLLQVHVCVCMGRFSLINLNAKYMGTGTTSFNNSSQLAKIQCREQNQPSHLFAFDVCICITQSVLSNIWIVFYNLKTCGIIDYHSLPSNQLENTRSTKYRQKVYQFGIFFFFYKYSSCFHSRPVCLHFVLIGGHSCQSLLLCVKLGRDDIFHIHFPPIPTPDTALSVNYYYRISG